MQMCTSSVSAIMKMTKHGAINTMFGHFHNGRHGGGTHLPRWLLLNMECACLCVNRTMFGHSHDGRHGGGTDLH